MSIESLFPDLAGRPCGPIGLEAEAAAWRVRHPADFPAGGPNPFLRPDYCGRLVEDFHRRRNLAWSYGGYLENRRELWRGSYLEATGNFLHLGIDCHAPPGTRVMAPPGRVLSIDDDHDPDGGWGPRVFLRSDAALAVGLVFAHLEEVAVAPGDRLDGRAVIGRVGSPPANGNWAPHLHIQAVRLDLLLFFLDGRLDGLDGYGHPSQREQLQQDHPDPGPYLPFHPFIRPPSSTPAPTR